MLTSMSSNYIPILKPVQIAITNDINYLRKSYCIFDISYWLHTTWHDKNWNGKYHWYWIKICIEKTAVNTKNTIEFDFF